MAPRETLDYSIEDGPILTRLSVEAEPQSFPGETQIIDSLTDSSDLLASPSSPNWLSSERHRVAGYQEIRSFYVIAPTDDQTQAWSHEIDLPRDTLVVALRRFLLNDERAVLLAHADNLNTYVVHEEALKQNARPARDEEIDRSVFINTLAHTREHVIDRIREDIIAKPAFSFVLTVDLCQSRRRWDEDLFRRLIDLSNLIDTPISIGVAITGRWALRHKSSFEALKRWSEQEKINIIWINHSMNHPLRQDRFGRYLFLTDRRVDFRDDVLSLEVLLLENGITPSIWFRFPGLVYDERVLSELNQLSLLPLDANVWLANTAGIEDGSVVLVHGNGNERSGLRKLFVELDAREKSFITGKTEILPVSATIPTPGDFPLKQIAEFLFLETPVD